MQIMKTNQRTAEGWDNPNVTETANSLLSGSDQWENLLRQKKLLTNQETVYNWAVTNGRTSYAR